ELFPKTGVILRDAFPSPRETQLHMIAGSNHDHYDDDSGSITLWGKGRVIADDFGYVSLAPQSEHNLLMAPGLGGLMYVKAFATSPALDYVQGVKGTWTRQIAFVKSADPLGPAYFVFNDSLNTPSPYTWQIWLTARNVTLGNAQAPAAEIPREADGTAMDQRFTKPTAASRALMIGREDVDADLFILSPAKPMLRTEKKTRPSLAGLDAEGKQSQMTSTQIGLIAESPQGTGASVLVYPRLKTAPPPTLTTIADGRGVKVQTEAGTDYVFLSPTPITYTEGDISFAGTVGAIQLRGKDPVLSLGATGTISARGKQLTQ
ncbi:MAG TPA: hypothetical protein PLZ36_16860, partial [Armatimonadota bacterium]|nr:hypothetical protein [Armatimonadota bacterium]